MTEHQMPAWEDAAQKICEAVETATADTVRKTCDDIYESVMETVQDYLKENVAFNLASKLAAYEREAVSLRKENVRCAAAAERMAEALEAIISPYGGFHCGARVQEQARSALSAFRSATQDTEAHHD